MIQDNLPRYQETADGTKTAFSFPFDPINVRFIEVYLDDIQITSGWSLSGTTITFTTAPAAGTIVTIYRNIPISWETTDIGPIGQSSLEQVLTRIVAQIQTIKEGLNRAIRTRVYDSDSGTDISSEFINNLSRADALYNQAIALLEQIQTEAEIIDETYTRFIEEASSFVTLTANQVITANKTFTQEITKKLNVSRGVAPESTVYPKPFVVKDVADKMLGNLQFTYGQNMSAAWGMLVYNCNDTTDSTPAALQVYNNNGVKYATCPDPTDTTSSTNSKQIPTVGWGNIHYVTLDTDQTISGEKTFTNGINYSGTSGASIRMKFTDIDMSQTNNNKNHYFGFFDKNDVFIGGLQSRKVPNTATTSGETYSGMKLMVRKQGDTTTQNSSLSYIGIYYSNDVLRTYVPTTPITYGTNAYDIVNCSWANTYLQAKITGGATSITGSNLTASRALVSNSSGKVAVSAVTSTELGYLDGVTSAIQTQLNAKAADSAVVKLTGNQTIGGTKTFSSTISGSINGNAATVTNGVYTTGDQNIGGTKSFTSSIYAKSNTAVKGTDPSSSIYHGLSFKDKNEKTLCDLLFFYNTGKGSGTSIRAVDNTGASTSTVASLSIYCKGSDSHATSPELRPFDDNTNNLGTSSARWRQLYAGTTTINTSDERVKQQIEEIPEEVLITWGKVNFYQYKFNDAVAEKGENARLHTGMIAQRIRDTFIENDLDAFKYGLLCYDEWENSPEVLDDEGNVLVNEIKAGNRFSLRYDECLCMEAAYQRYRANKLEERIKLLEERFE